MTQFLLATTSDDQVANDYEVATVQGVEWLERAARRIFPKAGRVTQVKPIGGEMDSVVDVSREQVRLGQPLPASALGILLSELALESDFALFWGNDHDDLPSASTLHELWRILEPQLLTDAGNWELYARYCRTVTGRHG